MINNNFDNINTNKPLSVILIMVCMYIMLVIERPWESISYLNGWPIERGFALAMILFSVYYNKFKIIKAPTNKWIYGLLFIHFALSPFAYNYGYAIDQSIEYSKMVVLYLLMLAVVEDESSLKILIKTYVLTMILYAIHSLWEYHNGRYMHRMGISRMMGVGELFSDPNAFAGSLVISLPIAYVVARDESCVWLRRVFWGYVPLVVLCVIFTGSRGASVALICLVLMWVLAQIWNRKFSYVIFVVFALPVVWNAMPEEKQIRIQTIWDSDAGPANAHESMDGRKLGWKASWTMFKQRPLTGVGAGGNNFIEYRINQGVDDSAMQAHVLYGEVLAEFGIGGAVLFSGLVISIISSCVSARNTICKNMLSKPFLYQLSLALITCLILLLILGFGGHNFYRPMWLWLAAWSSSIYGIANSQYYQSAA